MRASCRFFIILWVLSSSQAQAITCYLTMVKDNCWKSYDLTVDVFNANSGKPILTIEVPEGEYWSRKEFACAPSDVLAMAAKFKPEFWAGDEKKTFLGQRYWKLPEVIKPGETAWNLTVCYPKYFANVPHPPDASAHCSCDIEKIPKVEPK